MKPELTKSENDSADALFELGRLYFEKCDFKLALVKLNAAAEIYYQIRDLAQFLKCQNMVLRIYAEMEDSENVRITKEKLQDLVLKEGFELNAKTYYTLGICASLKSQYDVAIDYFQKSLAIGLSTDSKQDICYAINGLAITYYYLDKLTDALKEIYNLQVFFQMLNIPELKLSSDMLNAHILRKMRKYDQALEIFWGCYESLKTEKNMYIYLYVLWGLGRTYKDAGELDLARVYLRLARKVADPENLKAFLKQVDEQLNDLGVSAQEDYDLIFDSASNSVVEKKKGKVDFKNQFILLDMLRLFMKQPGSVFSKEALVKYIWKQEYDPSVHDNKIYVTIKRLRKLIEPDFDKPKYIFRAKNGYYLNKNTKILMEQ